MSNKNLKILEFFGDSVKPMYQPYVKRVMELYQEKRIANIRTAEKLIEKLKSRGTGPQVSMTQINSYSKKQSIIGRLSGKTQTKLYLVKAKLPIFINERTKQKDGTYKMKKKKIFKNIQITIESSINKINDFIQEFSEDVAEQDVYYDDEQEYDDVEDVEINPVPSTTLSSVKLGYQKYSYKCLTNCENINVNEGQCVIDYILYELEGKSKFRRLTHEKLIDFFGGELVTTSQIIDFAKQSNYVSVYAIDPLFNVFNKYIAHESRYTLCFIVNNNHLYPIIDTSTKQSVAKSNKLILDDYKFNVSYEDNIEYIDDHKIHIPSTTSKVELFNNNIDENVLMKQI